MIKLNTIEMAKILEHPAARLDQIMGHIWVYKKNS